jgi:hypothetical protein
MKKKIDAEIAKAGLKWKWKLRLIWMMK